jgi:hypothetical protein
MEIDRKAYMTKSEKISEQFQLALNHLDLAESIIHRINEIGLADHDNINAKFVDLVEMIEDLQYQIVSPMQVEEDEREEEIRVLERRLAELKSRG